MATTKPVPSAPISAQAEADLKRLMDNVPSTGKGALNIAATQDGVKVDVAHRFNKHISSSAYWQKIRNGSATWGAKTTVQW